MTFELSQLEIVHIVYREMKLLKHKGRHGHCYRPTPGQLLMLVWKHRSWMRPFYLYFSILFMYVNGI